MPRSPSVGTTSSGLRSPGGTSFLPPVGRSAPAGRFSSHFGTSQPGAEDDFDFDQPSKPKMPVELVVNAAFEAKTRQVDAGNVTTMVADVDEAKRRGITVDQLYTERTPLVTRLKYLVRGLQGRPKYTSEQVFKLNDVFARSIGAIRPTDAGAASTEYMTGQLHTLNTVSSRVLIPLLEKYVRDSKGMDALEKEEQRILDEYQKKYDDIVEEETAAREAKRLKDASALKQEKYHAHLDWADKIILKKQRLKGTYVPPIPISEEELAEAAEELALKNKAAGLETEKANAAASASPEVGGRRRGRRNRRSKSSGASQDDSGELSGSGGVGGPVTAMTPLPKEHSSDLWSAQQVVDFRKEVADYRTLVHETYTKITEDATQEVAELTSDLDECLDDLDQNQEDLEGKQEDMDKDQDQMDDYIRQMKALQVKMQELRDDMDERQDEMDDMEGQRRKLMTKKDKLTENLTMAKGWEEVKKRLMEFAHAAADCMDECAQVEVEHKADNLNDTLSRCRGGPGSNDGGIIAQIKESYEHQDEKIQWLEAQIKEADERDEEETEAEMTRQRNALQPIYDEFREMEDQLTECIEELEERLALVGGSSSGGGGGGAKKKDKPKKEDKKDKKEEPPAKEEKEKKKPKADKDDAKEDKGGEKKKEDKGEKKKKDKKKDK